MKFKSRVNPVRSFRIKSLINSSFKFCPKPFGTSNGVKNHNSPSFFPLSAICYLLFAFLLSGCSIKSIALRSTIELIGKGTEAFYEESDLQLAEESMTSQLKLLEILLKNDPENSRLLLFATQGFGVYAFSFMEEKDPERAKVFYERGRNFGLRYLQKRCSMDFLNTPDFDVFEKGLQKLKRKDVPLLFWTAYCWGGLCNLSRENSPLLADLPKVEQMMLKVNELFPGYFYGGADIFLGSYYGSRPKIFGGDLEKAKFYFDRALKFADDKFLITLVLYAKHYAISAQDKSFFRQLLEKVIKFPVETFPEQRLSNEIAMKRAKKMLEEIDERF